MYICTTSEVNYACEMWRLLDPGNHIIPAHKFHERLVCVRQVDRQAEKQKLLSSALHIGSEGTRGYSMPMTIIVDDRKDVGRWCEKVLISQTSDRVCPSLALLPLYCSICHENLG